MDHPPTRPTVLIAEELSPAAIEVLSADFALTSVDGADRAALLPALADADAVIVRSATQIDAEAVAAGPRLRVVARAGVGLDNIDVEAATSAGVLVVNAPTSNITSAAEHAIALMLACIRHIPAANASLKSGEWKRSRFTGMELAGKTVGLLGLGRIGQLVAARLAGFEVTLLAYDPYVPAARAGQLGARLVSLEELLAGSDVLSIHLPKTPETLGLLGERELSLVKPGVRIVNAARGGLIDEPALAVAIKEGRVAGAAIDVFATEPCTDSPVFGYESVVVTPHLGASTTEAQEKAGTAVARSVRLALRGEFVPDAVNVQAGGPVAEDLRPGLPLMEMLGRVFTGLAEGVPASLTVEVRGEIAAYDVSILQLAALKGLFTDVVEEQVTYVNAPLLAAQRDVEVRLVATEESPEYRNLLSVRGTLATGEQVSVSGTLAGTRQVAKITEVNGYDVEIAPTEHLAFFTYHDEPGIVGKVGNILGGAGVNIAGMQVARQGRGGHALMVLTVDSALPAATLTEITETIGAHSGRKVDLVDR